MNLDTNLELMERDWFKRRSPGKKNKIVQVVVTDYKQEINHFCRLLVKFEDGTEKSVIGRVLKNEKKGFWAIDGMELAVKVVEPDEKS